MSDDNVVNMNSFKQGGKWIVTILVIAVIALLGTQSFAIISAGHSGIVLQLGAVQPKVLQEGLHFKIPFIQTVIPIEVRVQKSETSQTSASRDLQTVSTTIAVNHHLDANSVNKLYQQVGLDYNTRIVDPAIAEALKAVTAQYTAEELISKRSEVSAKVKELLTTKLSTYYIVLDEINIREFTFSEEFNRAIESKQIAEQQALKSKLDLERIKIEKEQEITKAQAQAEALRLQKQEVTPELIQLRQIEAQLEAIRKWDGKMPNVTGGAMPFIDVNKQ
ncbi:prohibitin family protein [Brevibacillus panacihumi]|uniref:Prohibitin family protein n=1 Tax=Brevibacillus panacihumi TaxID=497735 RepID=A0A3M8C3X7_9BACL|nr:prohibitin family protein [Brevibacillus panacihumi]RNB69615.1 prohibitin family protein [Brevibacillus panacihumi]